MLALRVPQGSWAEQSQLALLAASTMRPKQALFALKEMQKSPIPTCISADFGGAVPTCNEANEILKGVAACDSRAMPAVRASATRIDGVANITCKTCKDYGDCTTCRSCKDNKARNAIISCSASNATNHWGSGIVCIGCSAVCAILAILPCSVVTYGNDCIPAIV